MRSAVSCSNARRSVMPQFCRVPAMVLGRCGAAAAFDLGVGWWCSAWWVVVVAGLGSSCGVEVFDVAAVFVVDGVAGGGELVGPAGPVDDVVVEDAEEHEVVESCRSAGP